MPKQDCLLCAADEALFLDIFTHGEDFHDIIENYLSFELQKEKLRSTKICYKCAYELIECNKFVDKFNEAHESKKKKSVKQKGHCLLCSEPGKQGFIYELENDDLDDLRTRLQELFDFKLLSSNKSVSVCLYCRYNLDVLADLKNIAKTKLSTNASKFKLPQMRVIKRKTTSIPDPSPPNSSDTDSSTSGRSKKNFTKLSPTRSSKNRQCDECECKVENDTDMYKFHRTGQKLCKDCWVSMNAVEVSEGRKTRASNTKSCAVVLKDVLTNPGGKRSKATKKAPNVEKNVKKREILVISDDSDVEQTPVKSKASKKGGKRASSENDTNSMKKAKRDMDFIPPRQTRGASVMSTASTTSNSARSPKRRHSDNVEEQDTEPKRLRTRTQKETKKPQFEKPVNEKTKKVEEKSKPPARSRPGRKVSKAELVSSSDEASKPPKKITKSSKRTPSASSMSSPQRRSISPAHKNTSEDTPNLDEGTRRSTRVRKSTKHLSETSNTPDVSEEDIEVSAEIESKKKAQKSDKPRPKGRPPKSASKSPAASKASASKSPASKTRKKEETDDEEIEEKIDDDIEEITEATEKLEQKTGSDGDSQPYTCTFCDIEFQTRLEGMTHQLTHSRKLGVVLEKVSLSESVQSSSSKEETVSATVANEKDEEVAAKPEDQAPDKNEATKDELPKDEEKSDETEAADKSLDQDQSTDVLDKSEEVENKGDGEEQVPVTVPEEAPNTKGRKKSVKVAKSPKKSEEPETTHSKEADVEESTSDKLPEDTPTESNKTVEDAEEAEKSLDDKENDEAENKKEETENKESMEKEDLVKEDSPEHNFEKELEKGGSQQSEDDSEVPEKKTKEPIKEFDHLTNGKDMETPETEPEDQIKEKEVETNDSEKTDEAGIKSGEEKVGEVDENGAKNAGGDKAPEVAETKEVESKGVENNEEDLAWESDEEKSPEAEPLSPPRRNKSTNGEIERPQDVDKTDKKEEKLGQETKCEDDKNEESKKTELNSNGEKSEDCNINVTEATKDAGDSSELTKQLANDVHIDEASMDAIERQMETIVGGKNTPDGVNSVSAAGEQQVA